MRETEKNESDLITSGEDILNRYPGLFTQHNLDDEILYYLENPVTHIETQFRFMILPAGVVSVSSLKQEDIWNIENYKLKNFLILTINDIAKSTNNLGTRDIKQLVKDLHFDTDEYFLRVLPYSDKHSSEVIKTILDRRYKGIDDPLPLTMI